MKNDLSKKINYIKATVPIQKVLPLVGVDTYIEDVGEEQIHCPFHSDSNKSARLFIREDKKANGIYCWVCGNFTTWDIAFKHFQNSYKETLNYFENDLGVDFSNIIGYKDVLGRYNKKLIKIVNRYRGKKIVKAKQLIKLEKELLKVTTKINK